MLAKIQEAQELHEGRAPDSPYKVSMLGWVNIAGSMFRKSYDRELVFLLCYHGMKMERIVEMSGDGGT